MHWLGDGTPHHMVPRTQDHCLEYQGEDTVNHQELQGTPKDDPYPQRKKRIKEGRLVHVKEGYQKGRLVMEQAGCPKDGEAMVRAMGHHRETEEVDVETSSASPMVDVQLNVTFSIVVQQGEA